MIVVRRMNGCGAGFESASVGGVRICHIEMCRHWTRRILRVGVAEFDDIGGADGDFGVHDRTVGTRHADAFSGLEGENEKVEKSWCPLDEEVRRDVVETRTSEIGG